MYDAADIHDAFILILVLLYHQVHFIFILEVKSTVRPEKSNKTTLSYSFTPQSNQFFKLLFVKMCSCVQTLQP